MASKCNKFLPNIFNKTKCQHCFAAKEAHSAAALENNKASRKVSRCGYLFVSPGYDFSNPLDRTRRWQRRFFRLYDDGELSYCVDENPDTVPQGTVDMNICTDVIDAETTTTHPFSLGIITPEKTIYIKGNSKEEVQWWHDILAEFPKALKAIKPRRKQPMLICSNKENGNETKDNVVGASEPKQGRFDLRGRIDVPAYATFKGVRSLKHRYDSSYQEGLRKSSSLHDLSSEDKEMRGGLESTRYLSRSGDRLDYLNRDNSSLTRNQPLSLPTNPHFTMPRSTWTRTGQPVPAAFLTPRNPSSSLSSISSQSSANSGFVPRRGSWDDRPGGASGKNASGKLHRERSSSLKDFPSHFSIAREGGEDGTQHSMSADETDSNETDELKMARSSELNASSRAYSLASATSPGNTEPMSSKYEDLVYMKKGWLIKQAATEKESRKHWFVLAGNSLRYYKDAKAEEANLLDGRIDLSSCHEVSEIPTHRNYGFKIKTGNGEYTLAAMTMGIRNNWMKAIRLCMELHSTVPKWKLGSPTRGSQISSKSPPRTAVDDLEFKSGAASSSTAAVTGAGGETTFQLVGRRDPYRRETQKPARRHHSDVNPGNVSKVLSVREFTASLEPAADPLASSGGSIRSTDSSLASGGNDLTPRASKIPRHRSPSNESLAWQRSSPGSGRDGAPMMKRYVEGSDNLPPTTSSGGDAQGPEHSKQTPKRNITSESTKEEVKREMMRRAKSPSARVKEKSRAAKTPRLHSPISAVDDAYGYHMGSATASEAGSAVSDGVEDPAYADIQMSEDEYMTQEEDRDEVGSATASDVVGMDGGLVEILETEVESLKDRLEHTQTELDQMHKDNMDLKTRLHKESTQSLDSGYSGRWGQNSNQSDTSSGRWGQNSNQGTEPLKRQLKEARDTVQRQRMDIEALKSKLDMSVSKLTGTEKALSEALKDYKQEKDKFLKLSSEWNRRIRTMESQSKDNIHKLERNREALQAKERECRRLEVEVKNNLQRTREQEREILKLKAVEHEYNQLKEKLDDRDQDLANLRSELKEKDHLTKKMKEEYEQQLEEVEREYGQERDDLELHLEELKSELYSAHDRQASMSDNMTSNMADMLKEKDDIIAQLEDKMIEVDKKLVEMSDELHVEMGGNAELVHTIDVLRNDKMKLSATIDKLENQLMSLKSKVSGFESDNFSLKRQLDELHQENTQLHDGLASANISSDQGAAAASKGNLECEKLKKTIVDLNGQIKDLQVKLETAESVVEKKTERGNSEVSSISSLASDHQQDLLHSILVVDSQLKEVNTMLLDLRQNFDSYIDTLDDGSRGQAIPLADLAEDIGHKCQDIQDTLRDPVENVLSPTESDLKHVITVTASSNSKIILDEYKGLKVKFDQAVSELRKVKKDLKETYNFQDSLKHEDMRLKEKMDIMEGAYKQEIVELIARVDSLTNKIVNVQTDSEMDIQTVSPFSEKSDNIVKEIEGQLNELDSRLSSLEQQAANLHQPKQSSQMAQASNSPPDGANGIRLKLEDVKTQLEETNAKLKSLSSSFSSSLASKVESCKERIGSVSAKIASTASLTSSAASSDNPSQGDMAIAGAGFSACLHEIRKKVQEIGEQLDSIEENDEDSDSEDGDEQSTVEEIREKLSGLTEFIEQHSKMTTSDWTLLRLMSLQKDNLKIVTDQTEDMEASISSEDKLKVYSDRLSLEAVLLSEMANILQTKDYLTPEDAVSREIECLNSQVLQLHQKLDNEIKTMHFENPQADVLASYAELMAEKILVNGQLFHDTLDCKTHLDSSSQPSIQPVLLATEALLRSQIDSFISSNMDKTSDEILSLPTHLTARTIVQGEFTFALNQLKSRLQQCPEALEPGPTNYQFMFDRLRGRQERVLASLECYEKQLVHSLAVIIFKESEEMTIVQGPESVFESLCSDLSTILETHIQHFKERCRTASDTHSAHKYDIIVNELRSCREVVLSELKSQHEAYARDPKSIRDSSLDVPVQSLDNTIANFGEILSLKAIVKATSSFLTELLKMGSAVLSDLELDQDSSSEAGVSIEKGLTSFVNALSEALQAEALSKEAISKKIVCDSSRSSNDVEEGNEETRNPAEVVLRVPDLSHYPQHLSGRAETIVREAVFSAQLTFSIFKQKLYHDREMQHLKARRPVRVRPQLNTEESNDSDDTLDLQTDFQALLVPLEEVLENKHDDELEALQVVLGLVSQMKELWTEGGTSDKAVVEDQLRQLEQKLQHELEVAQQRHDTHLEVFKQESSKLEKTLEEQQQDRDHYEDRCCQLEDELTAMQLQHEEDKDRVKQDILTAVHAIRSNDEKSEMSLIEKSSKLTKELAMQKLNFKKVLTAIKKDVSSKEKSAVCQIIEDHIKSISLSDDEEGYTYDSPEREEQGQESQPPLPSQPPPDEPDGAASTLEEVLPETSEKPSKSQHQHQVELLKKEKEAALAEEMRNTKAALEAVKSAYEDELAREKEKYKEMLMTMYTEEYINEIRCRHQEEEERMSEELQKLNMHYSSKFEDYKLLEMKLQQTKQDYESHINQLIASNNHLEEMLNREIDSLKDFIKNKPSSASLTTGSATMEEELYDAKIMVRVKDAELQKLRSQVKNLENSLHRTTEEQRQTMTQYMQSLKTSGESKKQLQEEVAQLTEKLNKVLGSQGLKANIRRTPSFHQRARSPSPESSPTPRKESDHSSRDSHRRRHIHPKDLRRSKSSPSLPYVFDGKGSPSKLASAKAGRRSRSPKT